MPGQHRHRELRLREDGGHPAEVGGGEPVRGVEGEAVLEVVGDGAAADVVSDVIVLLADVDHVLSAELGGHQPQQRLLTDHQHSLVCIHMATSGGQLFIFYNT